MYPLVERWYQTDSRIEQLLTEEELSERTELAIHKLLNVVEVLFGRLSPTQRG